MRLSNSSFTGTDRTLVAVGRVRLDSMLAAVRADAPRSRSSDTASASPAPSPDFAGAAGLLAAAGRAAGELFDAPAVVSAFAAGAGAALRAPPSDLVSLAGEVAPLVAEPDL